MGIGIRKTIPLHIEEIYIDRELAIFQSHCFSNRAAELSQISGAHFRISAQHLQSRSHLHVCSQLKSPPRSGRLRHQHHRQRESRQMHLNVFPSGGVGGKSAKEIFKTRGDWWRAGIR